MIPVVVIVGLIGNILSMIVFSGSYLKRYSSNVYLSALAFSDIVFLLCLMCNWTSVLGTNLYGMEGWCQTLSYLTYVSSYLSVW